MKEKLFIQESDLGDILEAIAEEAMEKHEIYVSATIRYFMGEHRLTIEVRNNTTHTFLSTIEYTIIKDLQGEDDVVCDSISKAIRELRKKEEEQAAQAAKVEMAVEEVN